MANRGCRLLMGAAVMALVACGQGDEGRSEAAGPGTLPDDARAAVPDQPVESRDVADGAVAERTGGAERATLARWFDCLRENGAITIAAHRGGPASGYPENALETLQYNFSQGIEVFEIDVAESQDGVLWLHHDRSLGRTTTGDGQIVEWDWDDLRRLRLKDTDGVVTDFSPVKLTDVLVWAKDVGAILELDRKSSTSFRNILSAVRAAEAEDHVVIISYTSEQAEEIARLSPDVVFTASARSRDDLNALRESGINLDNLVAWTGTREPNPAAWRVLSAEGVEPAFGTLGRPGERLDDTYAADGDLSEFVELAEAGLVLVSTDIPLAVADVLEGDDRGKAACPR